MYLLFKLFHVVAVILFLGNIITGLFWKFHADRAKDPRAIEQVFDGIIRSDRWFTMPGSVMIVVAGVGAAIIGEFPILGTGWILWSIVLFSLSGLAFGFQIAPLQVKIRNLAMKGIKSGKFSWSEYHRLARTWEIWGLVGMLSPVGAVILMVLKPVLPAF